MIYSGRGDREKEENIWKKGQMIVARSLLISRAFSIVCRVKEGCERREQCAHLSTILVQKAAVSKREVAESMWRGRTDEQIKREEETRNRGSNGLKSPFHLNFRISDRVREQFPLPRGSDCGKRKKDRGKEEREWTWKRGERADSEVQMREGNRETGGRKRGKKCAVFLLRKITILKRRAFRSQLTRFKPAWSDNESTTTGER